MVDLALQLDEKLSTTVFEGNSPDIVQLQVEHHSTEFKPGYGSPDKLTFIQISDDGSEICRKVLFVYKRSGMFHWEHVGEIDSPQPMVIESIIEHIMEWVKQ